jgi:autotransporter translocation and assembly factor TamB
MTLDPSARFLERLWGRPWFRRMTYLLAAGGVVAGTGIWTVRQPFFRKWVLTRLDAVLREETGLGMSAESLEVDPLAGRLVLRRFAIGDDLLTADRLDVRVDLLSLIGRNPHVFDLELENPSSVVSAGRLAKIHLKPRPDTGSTPLVRVDRFRVRGGRLKIQEPAWGLPKAEFTYRIEGKGLGPNRFDADLRVPSLTLEAPGRSTSGELDLHAELSDLAVEVKSAHLRLGRNSLGASGNYAFVPRQMKLAVQGQADLAEVLRIVGPSATRTYSGTALFKAEVRGRLSDPRWDISLKGKNLETPFRGIQAGDAELDAEGTLAQATIRNLTWTSPQGRLEAQGEWTRGKGSRLDFRCSQVSLAPLAELAKVGFLGGLTLDLEGTAQIPGDPWITPRPDAVALQAEAKFRREDQTAGHASLDLAAGEMTLQGLDLNLPELKLSGNSRIRLGARGPVSIDAQAEAETECALVADVLQGWDIGEGRENGSAIKLGMGGRARATATFGWEPAGGVRLQAQAEVEHPRWHGATLDRLRAEVNIQGDDLRIENIRGEKGQGSAQGSLWLTWRDLPPGQDQIDMCYQAFHLPIEEGLRAGDVGDLPISGTGSGWARIHGPYDRLLIEASGQAVDASVYGIRIPAASGDMVYDITGDRLTVKDVRVAEDAARLGSAEEGPSGLLALQGDLDLDLKRETWQIQAKGNVDSQPLGLPGPRFQASLATRLEGPWVSAFGPLQLPTGTATFSRGRLFLGQQSLEGMRGRVEVGAGTLRAEVGLDDKEAPLAKAEVHSRGGDLDGTAEVHLAGDSADTAHLAGRLTGDLVKDARLDLKARGTWNDQGLRWEGEIAQLVGRFDGFDLVQPGTSHLSGNGSEVTLDLRLQGQAEAALQPPAEMRVTGTLPFGADRPIHLQLDGTAELANLKSVLDHVLQVDEYSLLGDLRPTGTASLSLLLNGEYRQPSVDGEISLRGGRLEIRTYPQSVEDLSFNLHLKGRDLFLLESDPLHGRVAQGNLRAWGVASWDFGGLSRYDLQTRLEDFQLRDLPEGFELNGSLEASLQGTAEEGGIISGTLTARRMLYQADINLRDLILANAMGGVPSLGADPNDPLAHVDLDLDLVLSQPWEFDTNLLKLQGRPAGSFKILGSLAEPGFKGKMEIIPGGRLTNLLPAGDVVLERGSLEWTNPRTWFPNLDLQGRIDVSPYVVNLGIHGSLDGVEMKASSTPSLRQDEITAILIDPSSAPTLGTLSGASSQSAINSGLASTGSGLVTTLALANFQESVRRTLKLDRVSIAWRTGAGGTAPETSITVGKSLNLFGHPTPFVFTHQKSGDTTSLSGQVEWRFGNVVLQLGASQSGTNGIAPSGEIRHTWSPGW